jgi:hypothetical protein
MYIYIINGDYFEFETIKLAPIIELKIASFTQLFHFGMGMCVKERAL